MRKGLGFAAGIPLRTEFKTAYTILGKKDAPYYGISCIRYIVRFDESTRASAGPLMPYMQRHLDLRRNLTLKKFRGMYSWSTKSQKRCIKFEFVFF